MFESPRPPVRAPEAAAQDPADDDRFGPPQGERRPEPARAAPSAAPAARPSPFELPARLGGTLARARPEPKPEAPTPAPAVAAAPEPEPEPEVIPSDPAKAWRAALRGITRHQAVMIEENAAFGGFIDGTLFLNVRQDRWRSILPEHLREVDFVSYLPGFRRWELRLAEGGRTGREARTQEDERRATVARAAVASSPVIARLVATLHGRIDYIEASVLGGEEHPLDIEHAEVSPIRAPEPMEELEE